MVSKIMKRFASTLFPTSTPHRSLLTVPNFEQFFPNLLPHVSTFEKAVQVGVPLKEYLKQNFVFYSKIAGEILEKVPEWRNLELMNNKSICYHVLRLFYCLLSSEGFSKYSNEEKNIFYWVTLLHDIRKRGLPLLLVPKDPFHSYSSAAYALQYLTQISKADAPTIHKAQVLSNKIMEAKISKPTEYYQLYKDILDIHSLECIDISKLPELIEDLDSLFIPGSFHNTTVKMILMHQCLPTLKKFHTNYKLSESMISIFLNKDMLRNMKLFIMCDSNSYLLNTRRHLIEVHKEEFDAVFKKYELLCN